MHNVFAAPEDADSVRQVAREVSSRLGREGVGEFLRRAAHRAGLDVTPLGGFLLYRAASDGSIDVSALAAAHDIDLERLRDACRSLHEQRLLTGGPSGATGLSPQGAAAVDALADARCDALSDLAVHWHPGEHPELEQMLRELADDLATQPARA
jgi:hypothetical protein